MKSDITVSDETGLVARRSLAARLTSFTSPSSSPLSRFNCRNGVDGIRTADGCGEDGSAMGDEVPISECGGD